MKQFISVAIIFLTVFIACRKTSNSPAVPPANTVTASINGVNTTFNAIISVDTSSTPGTMYIVAHADSANVTPLLEITLTSNGSFTTGIYPDTVSNGHMGLLAYTGWDSLGNAQQYLNVTDTVNVTSSTRTTVSGTFQGTCQFLSDSTVTITNGKFTVGLPQQ